MNHDDHVRLVRTGIPTGGDQIWADFGSGRGAFTLALRDVAGPAVEIWSIDREPNALQSLQSAFASRFPGTALHVLQANFTRPIDLPPLDGVVAANSAHFIQDQARLLKQWRGYLKPSGRLIVVEYEMDAPNAWVPHPISFRRLAALAEAVGFATPRLLDVHRSPRSPSIYAAELRNATVATE